MKCKCDCFEGDHIILVTGGPEEDADEEVTRMRCECTECGPLAEERDSEGHKRCRTVLLARPLVEWTRAVFGKALCGACRPDASIASILGEG